MHQEGQLCTKHTVVAIKSMVSNDILSLKKSLRFGVFLEAAEYELSSSTQKMAGPGNLSHVAHTVRY